MAYSSKKTNRNGYALLRQELSEEKIRPVYLLSGEEKYLLDAAVSLLRRTCVLSGSESLDHVRIQAPSDAEEIIHALRTIPFMSPKKLVEVSNCGWFSSGKGSSEQKLACFQSVSAALNPQSVLCLIEDDCDKRQKKIYQALESAGGIHLEMDKQDDRELKKWMAAYLGQSGISIRDSAAESLITRCDGFMGELAGELEKLKQYCLYTEKKVLDFELVDLCCREDLYGNIFRLMDDVSAGRTADSLDLLNRMIRRKDVPAVIRLMLARHFRQLLAAKECRDSAELANELQLMPFVARRLMEQSRKFSKEKLRQLCEEAFRGDLKVKSGEMEERMSLELLIISAALPDFGNASGKSFRN